MFFDAKIIVALAFVVLSFLAIFFVRTRTTVVTTLIIAHLVLILFLSLSITSYHSFKEIVLALVAYSMVLLYLISNTNPIFSSVEKISLNFRDKEFLLKSFIALNFIAIIASAFFVIAINTSEIAKKISDKRTDREDEIMMNPMLLPSHPVHISVRKFYLGKKMTSDGDEWVDKVQARAEVNEKKQAKLKDKLADNFLLKRSSDVILIIVAISTCLLLLGTRKIENNNENNL